MTDTSQPVKTPSAPPSGVAATVAGSPTPLMVPAAPAPKPAAGVAARSDLPKVCRLCGARYPGDFRVCPRDATPLELEAVGADPFLGKVLGETYEIARLVGEGGMGRVYEARHLRLKDRRFAVKVLHPEFARQPDLVARFQREAESASSIGHPNVVDVYDVHKTPDGVPYLVGEFLRGEELGAYIKRLGKLSAPEAVGIARQVCQALAAAHARGIVHRDMKPDNVFMVEQNGTSVVKVLDFGISKAGSGETHLTRTGMIMGTPSYMAPEQARGENVDLRADVYAIGALLYHALTGVRPFDSDDVSSTLNLVLTEEPPRPRSLTPDIPEALELVVQRAMAKDPRERYQSARELDLALAAFEGGAQLAVRAADSPQLAGALPSVVAARGTPGRGIRATAMTMVVNLAGAPPSAELASREVRTARPTIVVVGTALALWLIGGTVDALGGVLRAVHAVELTGTEALLLLFGIVFIVATPLVMSALRVRKVVWPNSVKAVELSRDLQRTALAALTTYGALALVLRAIFTVGLRDSASVADGLVDTVLFVVSALGAVLAGGLGPLARSLRRKANG